MMEELSDAAEQTGNLIDAAGYSMSLQEIAQHVVKKETACPVCQRKFRPGDINHYPHDGGWNICGFAKKQWVYFVCKACTITLNLNKILRIIESQERIK